jgi:hypothetical protein
MRQSIHPAACAQSSMLATGSVADRIVAAHRILALINHVRFVMIDAENSAIDARLLGTAADIRKSIDSLDRDLRYLEMRGDDRARLTPAGRDLVEKGVR